MKKIIIVTGDPNSINSEIIYKTWKKLSKNIRKKNLSYFKFRINEKSIKKIKIKFKINSN